MSVMGCMDTLTPLASGVTVSPEQVLYESLGSVLVLGDDASVGEVAEIVAQHRRTVVFAPGIEARAFGSHVTAVGRQVTAVRGHLGSFQAEVRSADGASDIGAASPNSSRLFDIVLDLGLQPLLTSAVTPPGYFAPGQDAKARAAAIESVLGLVGRFTKPRYFSYQSDLCAHSASGVPGCTRCLGVCSAQAIVSTGATIQVDPHLCQGCATCTLACPTGALSFRFPSRAVLGQRLQQALSECGAVKVALIVHSGVLDVEVQLAISKHGALSMLVDPLPAFGEELWLRALALGAETLVLVDDGVMSQQSRLMITSRVAQMHALLPALGIARKRLAWLTTAELRGWLEARSLEKDAAPTELSPRTSAAVGGPAPAEPVSANSWVRYKRLAWLDGLRLLAIGGPTDTNVELPVGAAFGEVRVNRQRCTLCFACTNLCPTSALKANNANTQQLIFREGACVQCGLCVQGCPEKALSLHARFATQALARKTSVVLHQDEQILCKSCGTPFISRRLLASSLERLKDHPVMAQGGREALMTCPACRQREMLQP